MKATRRTSYICYVTGGNFSLLIHLVYLTSVVPLVSQIAVFYFIPQCGASGVCYLLFTLHSKVEPVVRAICSLYYPAVWRASGVRYFSLLFPAVWGQWCAISIVYFLSRSVEPVVWDILVYLFSAVWGQWCCSDDRRCYRQSNNPGTQDACVRGCDIHYDGMLAKVDSLEVHNYLYTHGFITVG